MEKKSIWFDMDGTIAELYKVDNWLARLRSEDPTPYLEAKPKVDPIQLANILWQLRNQGYTIGVISWLSMNSNKGYDKAVRQAKIQWLKTHVPFIFDKIHIIKYGTPKHTTPEIRQGILVDDNDEVRFNWENYGGTTIDARPETWLDELRALIE